MLKKSIISIGLRIDREAALSELPKSTQRRQPDRVTRPRSATAIPPNPAPRPQALP